jgi:hypothetical protein
MKFAAEIARSLAFFKVPQREQAEVLAAFAAHKPEMTDRYTAAAAQSSPVGTPGATR